MQVLLDWHLRLASPFYWADVKVEQIAIEIKSDNFQPPGLLEASK